jgi:hypothetical protein
VAITPDNVWAAGWYVQSPTDDRPQFTLVEHWGGTQWDIVQSPNAGTPGKTSSHLRGIFAAPANNLWVVGQSIDIASDQGYTLAMRWTGAKWVIVPTPNTDKMASMPTCLTEASLFRRAPFGSSVVTSSPIRSCWKVQQATDCNQKQVRRMMRFYLTSAALSVA